MFTQNDPVASILGQDEEPLSAKNPTSGGSSDTELNDPTASPTGPDSAAAVMTVTPVVKWPSTWRYLAESNGDGALMGAERTPTQGKEMTRPSWAATTSVTPVASARRWQSASIVSTVSSSWVGSWWNRARRWAPACSATYSA